MLCSPGLPTLGAVLTCFFRPLQVDGKDLPLLYTVSRDGAIFSWRFTPRPKGVPAKAPVAPALAPAAASEDAETAKGGAAADEEDEPVQDPSDFPFLARELPWVCPLPIASVCPCLLLPRT